MNAPSFFTAAPSAAAPSALPQPHAMEIPGGHSSTGSFSNALQRAASARENAPASKPIESKREAVKPREERGEAKDFSKSESAAQDDAKGKEVDRATMEAMACLLATSAVTPPVAPELTLGVDGTSALDPVSPDTVAPSANPAVLLPGPTLAATGQLNGSSLDSLAAAPLAETKGDPKTDLAKASTELKPLVGLMTPVAMQSVEKPKDSALTTAEVEAAAADAAEAVTAKSDAAKIQVSAAVTQAAVTPERVTRENLRIPKGADVLNGTPVAQKEGEMRKTGKRSESAEVAEQKLPGRGNSYSVAADKVAPPPIVGGVSAEGRSRSGIPAEADDSVLPALNLPTATVSFSEASPKEISSVPSGVSPADRVQNLMSTEIARFKQMRLDSMSVVLRPDPHTEISLNVKMSEGRIEAHAICQRGDFSALNAQWGQLQQSLSRQQVELAPLRDANTQNGNSDQSSSRGFAQSQGDPQPREEKPKLSFAEELAPLRSNTPANKTTPRPVVVAVNGRRWETWA